MIALHNEMEEGAADLQNIIFYMAVIFNTLGFQMTRS
jgi:hypothetical protein